MPIYTYTCRSCEAPFEKLVRRMGDDAAATHVECPECGSTQTTRELTAPAALTSVSADAAPTAGGCGRCGGPGPCAGGF